MFGNFSIAIFIARYALTQGNKTGAALLYGSETVPSTDAKAQSLVQQWIEYAIQEVQDTSASAIDYVAQYLNHTLQIRSFLVGHRLTVADLAVFEQLKASKHFKGLIARFKANLPHILRWYTLVDTFVNEHTEALQEALKKKTNTMDMLKAPTTEELALILPNCEMGKVVTRFPPEPSGYLHIGHAKAALLNAYFAKKYNGKLILRFDDTNPAKEKQEYVDNILGDLKRLGIEYQMFTHTSDYFVQLLDLAEDLIKQGKAYVDDTPREKLQEEKKNKIENKNRVASVEENMKKWQEMKNATDYGKSCCLRAKMDMQSDNGTMRDPIMVRYKAEEHPRFGNKFHLYPTYDFACPVVDSWEGVTHALRTSEYNDRNAQYNKFCELCTLRIPFLFDYSRMNFTNTVMSKRKLTKLVESKAVEGWNDPRFPTVQGLLRRGLTIDALYKFVLAQGASRNTATLQWGKLWTFNKQIIDPIVPRYTAISKDGIVKLTLTDGPATIETKQNPCHKQNANLGTKTTYYSKCIYLQEDDANAIEDGEEVTLMDWGNAIVQKINREESGKASTMEGKLNLAGKVKNTKKKLTWLAVMDSLVKVEICTFDHIISKPILDENDKFEDFVNTNSKFSSLSYGDPALKNLKKGEIIQLERRGYYICDEAFNGDKLVLFNIPDH